jgi:DeoR/GlpR family transcriptional regulator of sugar metabolism
VNTTEHRAGDLLEELLMRGVLQVDDLADLVGRSSEEISVDIDGDAVTITTEG